MDRTIHFIAGLPRSGSTLLCNVLAQNPRFQTTSTSGIVSVLRLIFDHWKTAFGSDVSEMARADRLCAMQAVLQAYHSDPVDARPVVFDKSRGWLGHLDLAEAILARKAKVLVCVRDLRDVLASFEKLWRKNAATWNQGHEEQNYVLWQTVSGRCEVLMGQGQVVGGAYRRIQKAVLNGYRDRLHFVEYEKMSSAPETTMQRIYQFLEEEPFAHDFDNVEQVTWEDDFQHGIPGLHNIRKKIAPMAPQWPRFLGEAAARFESYNRLWSEAGTPPVILPGEDLTDVQTPEAALFTKS